MEKQSCEPMVGDLVVLKHHRFNDDPIRIWLGDSTHDEFSDAGGFERVNQDASRTLKRVINTLCVDGRFEGLWIDDSRLCSGMVTILSRS